MTPEGKGIEDDLACYDLLTMPRDDGGAIIRLDFSACDDEEVHCIGAKEEKQLTSLGRSTLRPLFLYNGSEVWLRLDKQERATKELVGFALPAEDEGLRIVRERVAEGAHGLSLTCPYRVLGVGEPKLIPSLLEKRRGYKYSLLGLVEEPDGAVGIAEELIREVQLLQYLVDGACRSRCLEPPAMDAAGSSGTFHPF